MWHPLVPDLSGLSMEELSKKHSEIMNRLNQAYRFGPSGAVQQLHLLQQSYTEELQRRQARQMEEMQEQMRKNNPNFKDIIDIQ
jgi:hypothetical protein